MINWNDVFTYKSGNIYWKKYINGQKVKVPAGFNDFNKYGTRRRVKHKGKIFQVSRIIWEMHNGTIPNKFVIDHINGDSLDNRIKNLRCVTSAINNKNIRRRIINKTIPVGVSWNKRVQKWRSYITDNYSRVHLGEFTKLEDAIKVRKSAEKKLGYSPKHGEISLCTINIKRNK
jgi:hypothetical protein